jgi:hypothetical protein
MPIVICLLFMLLYQKSKLVIKYYYYIDVNEHERLSITQLTQQFK